MKKIIEFLLYSITLSLLVSACGATQPSVPSPTLTNTVSPTDIPTSTATSTAIPTDTPVSEATSTDTPVSKATPTVIPVPTRPPTATPDVAALNPLTVCVTNCDFVSIQAAIDDANTQPGDIIYVIDPVHTEAGIVVDKDVVIYGQGVDQTIVQAHDGSVKDAPDRVFLIPPEANVEIRAMTIQNGNPHDLLRYGGGILNQGRLTLSHVLVRYNQADCGGGIVSQGGTLTIEYSTISSNKADGVAPPGLECGSGGAIKLVEGGNLTMTNSTLSRNQAKKRGGGLHISCESQATLSNCTISDNQAGRFGGGINIGGEANLTHCTITGNIAKGIWPFQDVRGKTGGGISNSGTLNYTNTIIANHVKSQGDCVLRSDGQVGESRYNLVEDEGCSPTFSGDPKLAPLGDNGGTMQTHALQPDSPALDAISASDCVLDVDQRGQPRPVGQTSIDTPCDIGAVEMNTD